MDRKAPAEMFAPGVFIAEEIEARGWTVEGTAERLKWGPLVMKNVLSGEYALDWELANNLARVFGTSRDFWLNLQQLHAEWVELHVEDTE